MKAKGTVPEVVVMRLPLYLRALRSMTEAGKQVISSGELAEKLQLTAAQIRKDLSHFGRFGRQGRGYSIQFLISELHSILSLDREWDMVLVGVGQLGRAILSYEGFAPAGFRVVAAFDKNPQKVGGQIGRVTVQDVREMAATIARRHIQIGIVAVPPAAAQQVIEDMAACGIKAVLNYVPITPKVSPGLKIRNIDPVVSLQSMTYFLNRKQV